MRTAISRPLFAILAALMALTGAHAQEISGFSTMSAVYVCASSLGCTRKGVDQEYILKESAYIDTEEDYTASLYYDVSSASAMYYSGNSGALISGSISGNPTATTSYSIQNAVLSGTVTTARTQNAIAPYGPKTYVDSLTPGIYTETTDHIVNFFYVTSLGEYYDPYGFGVIDGNGGDYDSGYWFSVTVWATYLQEAAVVLGQSYDSSNNISNSNLQGPSISSATYQTFIPPAWLYGPPTASCPLLQTVIYVGDNRGFDPLIESYRAMQAISFGIGGLTSVTPFNAPPTQGTGWTYQFSSTVLQNNQIPASAYNWDYLGECSNKGINLLGKATTANMVSPGVIYNGTSSTQTTFRGSAQDPIPLWAFPVTWDAPLTLTETSATDLHVTGTLNATCHPAHEVSVGGVDLTNGGTYCLPRTTWPTSRRVLRGLTTSISRSVRTLPLSHRRSR